LGFDGAETGEEIDVWSGCDRGERCRPASFAPPASCVLDVELRGDGLRRCVLGGINGRLLTHPLNE